MKYSLKQDSTLNVSHSKTNHFLNKLYRLSLLAEKIDIWKLF
jgi:hypothetical protein